MTCGINIYRLIGRLIIEYRYKEINKETDP